jgi:hypothetical protein
MVTHFGFRFGASRDHRWSLVIESYRHHGRAELDRSAAQVALLPMFAEASHMALAAGSLGAQMRRARFAAARSLRGGAIPASRSISESNSPLQNR